MATTATTSVRPGILKGSSLLLGLALLGCAPARVAPASSQAAPQPKVVARGALLDYAPAAGLRWLVLAHPRLITEDPALSPSVALVLSPERLEAFAHATGVHLGHLSSGAVAGYALGTLYLAEIAEHTAPIVRERFATRLVEGGLVHETQGLYRVVGTTTSGSVRSLVTVDDRYLCVATDDATLGRIVVAYAERRLRSPTALRGAALSLLPPVPDDALFAFLAPGPFAKEWAEAARGLLASTLALSIVASKGPRDELHATLTLAGAWDRQAKEAQAELERAWVELQGTPTGRLLGLDKATELQGSADLQYLTLSANLPIGPLARGLHDATSADVREILELDAPASGSTP